MHVSHLWAYVIACQAAIPAPQQPAIRILLVAVLSQKQHCTCPDVNALGICCQDVSWRMRALHMALFVMP